MRPAVGALAAMLLSAAFPAGIAAEKIAVAPGITIPGGHPRIFFTAGDLAAVRARAKRPPVSTWAGVYVEWVRNGGTKYDTAQCEDYAFACLLSGDERFARTAIRQAFALENDEFHEGQRYSRRALVYDWLHDRLSADERSRLGKLLAGMLGPRTSSHGLKIGSRYHSAWLSAALALAGEGVADKAAAADIAHFMKVYTPLMKRLEETNIDGGSRHYAHVVGREWVTTYEMMQAATGGAAFRGCNYHGRQGAYWLYRTVGGYGCVPNAGDGTHASVGAMPPTSLFSHTAMRGKCPASQEMVRHLLDKKGARPRWEDILWYRGLPRTELAKLPTARIFRGAGIVVSRSGWNMDRASTDVVSVFYNGPTVRHTHLNQGHFQIYRGRVNLAPDAGFYDVYGGPHCENVFKTTQGHNCLTITGPEGGDGRQTEGAANRAKYPHNTWARYRGEITAFESNEHFTYVGADMTAAYGAAKGAAPRAKAVTRQFLHLGDDLFVVYDRVAAAGPGLKKRFILQSYDEPALDGEEKVVEGAKGDGVSVSGETGLITSVRGPSKLFCRVLLPEKRTVTKVGGPTYWCFSGGKFYKPTKSSFRDPQRAHREGMPLWRSEISPAGPSAFDDFLVVLEAAPGDRPSPVPCDLKLQGSAVRLAIDGQRARYEVNFLRSRDGGRIRITRAGRTLVGRDFTRRIDVPAGNPIVPAGG